MKATNFFDEAFTLTEVVVAADQAFRLCRERAQRPSSVDFPSLALHRHMIHMAHGVDVLRTASAAISIPPLLRSMLESLFSLEYIHKEDYERRSLCWLYAFIHQEIEQKELADPTTAKGAELQRIAEAHVHGWAEVQRHPGPDFTETLQDLKAELKQPYMQPIKEEFDRLTRKDRYPPFPKWHYMFNGVRNLYEMANETTRLPMYLIFYGPWSASVHGTDAASLVMLQENGLAEFRELSDPHRLAFYDENVRLILVFGTTKMLRRFGPPPEIDG